ncbi:Gfo/Idh/MocA family oxidoreductase [Streptococcus sobrinus]|nr:Gfo/Idh/MocA family oxidoreductase [Streptococcus sobrinus]
MLTMAYIGNGKSTNRYHLPFVRKLADKILVKTIYQRSNSSWPELEGIHYTHDLDDILSDPEISLVAICTPQSAHYELAKTCLEAGKNVLVEKPFTNNLAQARELFEFAKSQGLVVQAYQNRRFDSDFLTVQKVLASGKLGDLLEMEMHFDYYRPQVPESNKSFKPEESFLYTHACHTLDQVISLFGPPEQVHYDVRQLLGSERMNDYFDLDLYYGACKVSVKSSYFRLQARPSFALYGKKGTFIKAKKDRQEEDLKHFYLPDHADFGLDRPEDYGSLTYLDDQGNYHQEKVVSEVGDYSLYYQTLYETLEEGANKLVKDQETLLVMSMLEEGLRSLADQ